MRIATMPHKEKTKTLERKNTTKGNGASYAGIRKRGFICMIWH